MATSNPGPAVTSNPEPQMGTGNIQKNAILQVSLTPASTATATSAAQVFAGLGLGLLVGDQVTILPPSNVAGVFAVSAVVTATDTLSIVFANVTAGALTAAAGMYTLEVNRPQPNFVQNASYMTSF